MRKQNRAFFQISGAGHEALGLGLARELRAGSDWFFPYYRDRALVLGLGVTPTEILLQAVGGADDPASGGRQMPCHWGDRSRNIVTQSSPTGSQCLPAVGCAEASRYIVRRTLPGCHAVGDEVVYVSLGEGAASEGEFWESLSIACRLGLPVLFVVADNGYAISVRATDQSPAPISEMVRGFRGLHVARIDGRDYFDVRRKGAEAVHRVRAGQGPGLVHATVTRPYSHSLSDDQTKYRRPTSCSTNRSTTRSRCSSRCSCACGAITKKRLTTSAGRGRRDGVKQAADEAFAAPRPDPSTVLQHLFGPPPVTELPPDPPAGADDGSDAVGFGDSIHRTLRDEMARDERILVFGEDVADADPAVLEVCRERAECSASRSGLQREFGTGPLLQHAARRGEHHRTRRRPGVRGLRPCPEIQFFDYIWPAMQQLRSEAATIRWRSNGAFSCPMVVRVAIGGYLTGGAIWHSQCGESIFAHVPGLVDRVSVTRP